MRKSLTQILNKFRTYGGTNTTTMPFGGQQGGGTANMQRTLPEGEANELPGPNDGEHTKNTEKKAFCRHFRPFLSTAIK
jgi:hypothetical protein